MMNIEVEIHVNPVINYFTDVCSSDVVIRRHKESETMTVIVINTSPIVLVKLPSG